MRWCSPVLLYTWICHFNRIAEYSLCRFGNENICVYSSLVYICVCVCEVESSFAVNTVDVLFHIHIFLFFFPFSSWMFHDFSVFLNLSHLEWMQESQRMLHNIYMHFLCHPSFSFSIPEFNSKIFSHIWDFTKTLFIRLSLYI